MWGSRFNKIFIIFNFFTRWSNHVSEETRKSTIITKGMWNVFFLQLKNKHLHRFHFLARWSTASSTCTTRQTESTFSEKTVSTQSNSMTYILKKVGFALLIITVVCFRGYNHLKLVTVVDNIRSGARAGSV